MAVTFAVAGVERVPTVLGDRRAHLVTITATGTYTATGDSLDLATLLSMSRIDMVIFDGGVASVPGATGTTGVVPLFDYTNKKLKFYGGAAAGAVLSELTAATSVSTFVVRALVMGI